MRKQQLQQMRWLAVVSAGFLLLIFVSLSARAQEAGGSLVGVVSDPSGADIANANVSARNVATSTTRTGVTNSSGLYSIPDLIPGKYEVTVTAPGFSTSVVSDVGLLAGERREVNVSMTIGAVTQQVTVVSSEVADVQLATSEVRGVIDEHTVVELPLNGRDWTSLTLLEPGVAQIRTQKTIAVSNDRANRGLGVDVSIGGNRPQGNNYELDGVSINDYSSGAPGSITGAVLNPVNSNFKQNNLNYINLTCFTLPTAPASFASMCNGFSGATTPPPSGQVYCSNLLGNSGRNTVIGPGLQDLDFSLFKNNPIRRISENFNAQFRWEVFNIANHADFNPPLPAARQVFSATGVPNANPGMLATPTTQPSRQMQFALKLIW
jgi:hypothetical protein